MIAKKTILPSRNPSASKKRKRGGFTAVEVIIGASLMATLIAGMIHLIDQGNYLIELARDNTRVTQLIQSEVEDLRTLNWIDLEQMEAFEQVEVEGQFAQNFAHEYYCYRYITDSHDNPTDKKWVWVYVGWTDSNNRTHWVYYFTQFSKDGLNDYYYRSV